MRFAFAVSGAALLAVVSVGGCGDLFHSTDWTSLCDADPAARGCGAGGAGGSPATSHTSTHTSSSRASSSRASTGAGGEGGTGGEGGGPDPCPKYCDRITAACTGADAQYASVDDCLAVCPAIAPGDSPHANNIGCRSAAAKAAQLDPSQCVIAGPSGEAAAPADGCESTCDAYCYLMPTHCPGSFTGGAACLAACQGLPVGAYAAAGDAGMTQACILNWAMKAITDTTPTSCDEATPATTTLCVDGAGGAGGGGGA